MLRFTADPTNTAGIVGAAGDANATHTVLGANAKASDTLIRRAAIAYVDRIVRPDPERGQKTAPGNPLVVGAKWRGCS